MTRLAIYALALAALGCQGGGDGPVGPDPDPVPAPGLYSRAILSGGLQRSYLLQVPTGWSAGADLPLVLAFHGAGSDPTNLRTVSGLGAVADELDFLVAYPEAATGDWNTECLECGSNAVVDEIDDLGLVSDLVDRIDADVGVDRRRVYAVGNSPLVARLSGVGVGGTLIGVYALSGFCAALVGILLAGFSGQASLGMGDEYLLPSIAVVVTNPVAG